MPRQAAKVYNDVLTIMPPGTKAEPWLADALERARKAVEQNRTALDRHLKDRLEVIRARHAGSDLARFEEAKNVMIGTRKIYPQQPTLLHYPRLDAIPFYHRRDFPWRAIEAKTQTIREELAALAGRPERRLRALCPPSRGEPH